METKWRQDSAGGCGDIRLCIGVHQRTKADIQVHQHLGSDAFTFPKQTQQDVFRTYVIVVEGPSLLEGVCNGFSGLRRLREFARHTQVPAGCGQPGESLFKALDIYIQFPERRGPETTAFLEHGE